MGLIQKGIIQKKLREAMGVKEISPAPTMAPEVVPVIIAEDVSGSVPDAPVYDSAWLTRKGQTAVAAQYSYVELWNPATSGLILEVPEVQVEVSAASHCHLRWLATDIGAGGIEYGINRELGTGRSKAPFYADATTDALGNLGSLMCRFGFAAGVPEFVPLGVTIPPGYGISFRSGAVNETMNVCFYVIAGPTPE